MKEPGGECHCAARLADDARVESHLSHCAANLVFAHGNDVVNKAADVLEVNRPDGLRAQPVGQRARHALGWELHDLALAKALLRVIGEFWFNPDDLRLRTAEL